MTNTYRVPKKQWQKWNATARKVFNEVYGTMSKNPWVFLNPSTKTAPPGWKITAWNAAWVAADAVQDRPDRWSPKPGTTLLDLDSKGREVRRRKVA